jgi:hypothetical protein
MTDPHILPPEVAEILVRHAEYRRRLARLSFEEKIAIVERMRAVNTWRKQNEPSQVITPAGDSEG